MKLQIPDFKNYDKRLKAIGSDHQRKNPLLEQAKKFLEKRMKNG